MGLSYLGSALWQNRALPNSLELNLHISWLEGRACTLFVLLHPNNMAGSMYLVIKKKQANLWVLYWGKGISISSLLLFPRNTGFLTPFFSKTQETSYKEAANDRSTISVAWEQDGNREGTSESHKQQKWAVKTKQQKILCFAGFFHTPIHTVAWKRKLRKL